MRVYVGDQGPIAGVQAFEVTATEALNRFGEYDSEEQVIDVQIPETNGFVEMFDSERVEFYKALLGETDAAKIVDLRIGDFGTPWIAVNVWNKAKTKYVKAAFVKRPTFNNHPYPTNLNDSVILRWEFAASTFVKLPHHACAIDTFTLEEGANQVLSLSKSAVQLRDGSYVLGAVEKVSLGGTPAKYEYLELTVSGSTSSACTVARGDGTSLGDGIVLVYYAYVSTSETAEWPGQTV
jgi:hypothetical protein